MNNDVPSFLKPKPRARKPKPHKIRTFFLVVCLFCLIFGGAFYAFFYVYNTPENLAVGSLENLLRKDVVSLKGEIYLKDTAIEENGDVSNFPLKDFVRAISLKFDSKIASNSSSSDATLVIEPRNETIDPLEVNLGIILSPDGSTYLNFDGLSEVYAEMIEEKFETEDFDFFSVESPEDYEEFMSVDEFAKVSDLSDFLNAIDGNWIEVSEEDFAEFSKTNELDDWLYFLRNAPLSLKTQLAAFSTSPDFKNVMKLSKTAPYLSGEKQGAFSLFSDYYYATFDLDFFSSALEESIKPLKNLGVSSREDFITVAEISKTRELKSLTLTNGLFALKNPDQSAWLEVGLDFSYLETYNPSLPSEYSRLSDFDINLASF